jgi:hypothetical protein
MRRLLLLVAAMPLACAAPSPAASPAATAAAGSPASTTVASPPASPPISPTARILGALAAESGPDLKVKLVFENMSPWACRFTSYKLRWGSSAKEIKLDGVTIPAGETRERSIKLHPDDGDLAAFKVESARVEVVTDCAH